ncbi:MAG: hypothetical protein J6J42_03980 [Lachnospiraceae bacterium]|nr:hypothetical protein [Lachnospiraceae bacterium]
MERNLDLNNRIEDVRPQQTVVQPVQFELRDIKAHFDESLNAIKNQYAVADSLMAEGKVEDCKNIWRSQVVFIEGILDFYLHEMSKYGLYKMFKGEWSKSEQYKSLQIPILKVEEGIAAAESKEWFFEYLNDRFSRDVFLSDESMRKQLNLIGIEFGKAMSIAFPKDTMNKSDREGAYIVRELFKRRNAIAHQIDRDHASAQQNDITKEYVEECASQVTAIVEAVHSIAVDKG